MKIVVTGSLGHIGKPLTQQLIEKGHTVVVISSKADKQKDIEAMGATAAIGSLTDAAFLAQTFAGAEALFAMVPPNFGEFDQVAYYSRIAGNYAKAIQQAGVKRVVQLSSYGAHLDKGTGFILGSHHAEQVLEGVPGISLTHLRPGYFYYNLNNFAGMIKGAGIMGANYGGNDLMVLVDPADIATAAAEELVKTEGDRIRYVASDERTCHEIAKAIGEAIGKPDLQWLTFTDEQAKDGMIKSGLPEPIAALFTEMGAATHSGILREDYDRHKPATMGSVKLEDFAKQFAAGF